MPFLLHTSCLQIAFFLIRRPELLFAGNSRSPPQSPYPDTVPLRLFQILRYFPIWWLIGRFASSQSKCLLLTDLFYVVFPSDILFSLPPCYIMAILNGERCWKVLLLGSLYFWWPHWVEIQTPCHIPLCFIIELGPLFSLFFPASTQAQLKEYLSLAILWPVFFCKLYKDTVDSNVHLWDISSLFIITF